MDNIPTLTAFVQNILGVAVVRSHTELVAYIPTFRRLMIISETDIDEFIKQVHSSNSGHTANQRIVYMPSLAANLKALSFTLKDRANCNALYDAAGLAALDDAQLTLMKNYRSQALQDKSNDDAVTLPNIDVPKFTTENYDDFMAKFLTVVSRTKGVHGVSIDYIVRQADGYFNDIHPTRKLKMKACLARRGPKFQEDSKTLFGLYLQYIGTTGHGANLVKQFQPRHQGFNLHFAFVNHFANATHLQNKAAQAATDLTKLSYSGDKMRFKMEDYYNRMTQCFNDLANGGAQYALNDHQKIQAFCQGLKNATAVRYHVDAKQAWDAIQGPKDFDTYYNLFSSKLQQYCTLIGDSSQTDNRRINNVDTGGRGRSGRGGRFGRGGGRGCGRGRGRGRNSYQYQNNNPYQNSSGLPNFTAEARNYPQEMFYKMSKMQKAAVQQAKIDNGWKDGPTPPDGFTVNGDGYAIPSPSIVAAIQSQMQIRQFQQVQTPGAAPLPPPPPAAPAPIPATITTNNAGQAFGSSASRGGNGDASSIISTVNGRAYSGHVYDANGNRIS